MLPDELEAVRKAKMLYLSCMNESESNTFDLLMTATKGCKRTTLELGSRFGEGGLQANAEDAEAG